MTSAQDPLYAPISIPDDANHPFALVVSGWFHERHQPPRRHWAVDDALAGTPARGEMLAVVRLNHLSSREVPQCDTLPAVRDNHLGRRDGIVVVCSTV
jgi:hypothetical protein